MSETVVSMVRHTVTLVLAAFVTIAVATAPPRPVDRAEAIGSQIRCPVCQGEAIADSPAPLAEDMMDLVRQRIDEGLSDEQIISELISSYSGAQLLDPPFGWRTAALWAIPAIVAVVGVVGMLGRSRRRPGSPTSAEEPRPSVEDAS